MNMKMEKRKTWQEKIGDVVGSSRPDIKREYKTVVEILLQEAERQHDARFRIPMHNFQSHGLSPENACALVKNLHWCEVIDVSPTDRIFLTEEDPEDQFNVVWTGAKLVPIEYLDPLHVCNTAEVIIDSTRLQYFLDKLPRTIRSLDTISPDSDPDTPLVQYLSRNGQGNLKIRDHNLIRFTKTPHALVSFFYSQENPKQWVGYDEIKQTVGGKNSEEIRKTIEAINRRVSKATKHEVMSLIESRQGEDLETSPKQYRWAL